MSTTHLTLAPPPARSADPTVVESSENLDSSTCTDEQLFALMASGGPADRHQARAALIERHWRYAQSLGRRFRNRGEPIEDLCQVAAIGLIKAIDGFDPAHGASFLSYATPTVTGELRRHFRDKGWNVRVPRRLQEMRADLRSATERLTHELGREPTAAELAADLGTTEDDVREGLSAGMAYAATSLQGPLARETGATLADRLAEEEPGYEQVETCEVLRDLLPLLPSRERHIVGLRFYHELTQSQIAAELGISQMHVSRLISQSLDTLRTQLTADQELLPTG